MLCYFFGARNLDAMGLDCVIPGQNIEPSIRVVSNSLCVSSSFPRRRIDNRTCTSANRLPSGTGRPYDLSALNLNGLCFVRVTCVSECSSM